MATIATNKDDVDTMYAASSRRASRRGCTSSSPLSPPSYNSSSADETAGEEPGRAAAAAAAAASKLLLLILSATLTSTAESSFAGGGFPVGMIPPERAAPYLGNFFSSLSSLSPSSPSLSSLEALAAFGASAQSDDDGGSGGEVQIGGGGGGEGGGGYVEYDTSSSSTYSSTLMAEAFDATVSNRYACTRFHRYREPNASTANSDSDSSSDSDTEGNSRTVTKPKAGSERPAERRRASSATAAVASASDPAIVSASLRVLDASRRAPSGFNSQPYRVVLVSDTPTKEALAKACIGRNADRVRDSDCTAVFLADREWGREWGRFGAFLAQEGGERGRRRGKGAPGNWKSRYVRSLILLFSSGYPLPRFLASPLSFVVRTAASIVAHIFGRRHLVPTLSSAETWSTKNAVLVAMSYLLGCTAHGLATCPMEGYWSPAVRGALGVPRRYAVPLIVSTGVPYRRFRSGEEENEDEETDDVGMSHGAPGGKGVGPLMKSTATPRYPFGNIVFANKFGTAAELSDL